MFDKNENLAEVIINSLKSMGEKEAIHYILKDESSLSYSGDKVVEEINRAEIFLENLGLRKGDRILIMSNLTPYYLISLLGAIRIGIIPMLLEPAVLIEELNEIIQNAEIKAVLTNESYLNKIDSKFSYIPVLDISKELAFMKNSATIISMDIAQSKKVDEKVALILFSSGTTSKRKGVEITHKSEILSLRDAASKTNVKDYKASMLAILPFSHIAGLTTALSTPYYKSTLYMIEDISALKLSDFFSKYNIEYMGLIPKIYETFMYKIKEEIDSKGAFFSRIVYTLMEINLFLRKKYNFNLFKQVLFPLRKRIFGKKLEYACVGGTAVSSEVMDFYTGLGYTIYNVYASTETSVNMICTDWKNYDSNITGKVINDYVKVKLIECNDKGVGELVVKSPCLFNGYFKDEQATREAYTKDGFFKTGDLATLDKHGNVTIVGRRKESILLENGEKVSPETIEAAYSKIVSDYSYAVCGIQERKEYPFDTVYMFIEGNFSEKVKTDIRQRIFFENSSVYENYRISQIRFVSEFPRTSVGKVKKFMLKELILNQNASSTYKEVKRERVVDDLTTNEGRINKCIRECSGYDLSDKEIRDNMNLYNDLGYDSLSLFQLSIALENEFNKDLSQFFTADLSVGDINRLLCGSDKLNNMNLEYKYDINTYPQKRSEHDEKAFKLFARIFKYLYKIEYEGLDNIPSNSAVIICPNHISELDPLVLCFGLSENYRKNLFCICWDKFTATKKGRYFMRILNGIPIDRRSIGNPAATLKIGREYLQNKRSLVIFPEGTRTYDGSLGKFQNGAAFIAKEVDVPIIPVTMNGMFDAFAKTEKRYHILKNKKRIKIRVIFGKPIYGKNKTVEEFTEAVKNEIEQKLI